MKIIGMVLLAAGLACGSTTLEGDHGGNEATDHAGETDATDVPAETEEAGPDVGEVAVDVAPDVAADVAVDVAADVPTDVENDVGAEDGGPCTVMRLSDVPPVEVILADPVPVTVGRTTRIRVSSIRDCHQRTAMPEVRLVPEARRLEIQPRVWEKPLRDCMGPAVEEVHWIPVSFPSAGTWSVEVPAGTARLSIPVGAEPPSACVTTAPCDEDCDCTCGELCLGGHGLGGPFTACALPCEQDLDCPRGACVDVDDGFDRACSDGIPQCSGVGDCPLGFVCEASLCRPDFSLGSAVRAPCNCSEECAAPLVCAEPTVAGGVRRCEFPCPSAGNWCPGAHRCGSAADDLSGLASVDSVCGWLGD